MNVNIYKDGDAKRWDEYVMGSPGASLYHLSAWKDLISECFGHDTHYLFSTENGSITGILPMVHLRSRLFGSFMVSMPYFNYGGICADSPEAGGLLLETAIGIAKEAGAEHIELRDTHPNNALPVKTAKVSMRLKLPPSAEELRRSLPSKLRSQIKRPAKDSMYARTGGIEDLADFYSVFSINMRDLGTPVYPESFFRRIMERFPGSTRICTVYKDKEPVASGFLAGFRDMMEIPWAGSIKKYNRSSPNMLLYWSALEFSIDNGFKRFDFGRSSAGSGTFRFKKQWGAEPLQLYWHYWLRGGGPLPEINPDNPKYRALIGCWKSLPVWLTRVIGPSIVKNLP